VDDNEPTIEQWKVIEKFPNYSVSSICRVKNNNGRILKPILSYKGYFRVCLRRDGSSTYIYIHTLVLEAFDKIRPVGMQTRHRNGRRTDNRHTNLCWGTGKENSADQRLHGTGNAGEKHGRSKLTEKQVSVIRAAKASGKKHWGMMRLANEFGVSRHAVERAGNGKTWKCVKQSPVSGQPVQHGSGE
jgi:hypothetical protein